MQDDSPDTSDSSSGANSGSHPKKNVSSDVAAPDSNARSILSEVRQKVQQKNRRRKAPTWLIRLRRGATAVRTFIRQTIPAFLRRRRRELITGAVSFVVHVFVGLLLAAWLLPASTQDELLQLIGVHAEEDIVNEPQAELVEVIQPKEIEELNVDSTMQQMLAELDKGQHRTQMDALDPADITLPLDDLTDAPEIPFVKGDYGGRSEAGRQAAVSRYGGTAESEKSVNEGLRWLKSIQQPDGSWSFAKVGEAGQPGNLTTTDMGATSLALLCYLAAGHTHNRPGIYKDTVFKGLSYLVKNAERGAFGADLRGQFQGNSGMYVQGIATICICEALAMERDDKELKRLASDAVKFIERAQNRVDGGWRYNPGEAGDTSVVGWQVMALQSAKASRVRVLGNTTLDVKRFLDSVESENGALYSYMRGGSPRDSMTAVGLLCRMYLGWKRDNPALKAGVEHLARKGPHPGDIYFNYYATQVLHHWGGDLWNTWNLKMREDLVTTQIKQGPGAGSWDVTDPHGNAGGRLYQTTLSLLTLEVYYRHLPIYRRFDDEESTAAR